MRYTKKELKDMPYGKAIDYLSNFDKYCNPGKMRKYIADAIEKDDYVLAMHLLKTLIDHPCYLYDYDINNGISSTPRPVNQAYINNL